MLKIQIMLFSINLTIEHKKAKGLGNQLLGLI